MSKKLRDFLEKIDVPRILIVRLSSLGDVVHSLPVIAGLRKLFPKAYLSWIVEEKSYEVVEKNPQLDEVLLFEKMRWKKEMQQGGKRLTSWVEIKKFIRKVRQKKFDIAIDLQGLLRSGLITFLSGAPIRIGFADAREYSHFFYNIKIPVSQNIHAVDRYFMAVKFFGGSDLTPEFQFSIPSEEQSFAARFLEQHHVSNAPFLVGIFPFASLPHKCWGREQFALLSDALIERHHATILLFAGKQERRLIEKVAKLMVHKPIFVEDNMNARQLAALISRCNIFIGNDTGPLHIAVALGVPVVGLYGPSDPQATGPYGENNVCLFHDFPCAPCIRHPICQNFDCLSAIKVDEVLSVVDKLRTSNLGQAVANL